MKTKAKEAGFQPKNLAKWEKEMNVCIRCAYCFEGCPIYKELGWESDGARGKIILSYGLMTGDIKPSQSVASKIFQCSFCRDCIERCSAGVPVTDILTAARKDLFDAGFGYKGHKDLLDRVEATGNIYGKKLTPPIQEGETPVLLGCRFIERQADAKKYLEILEKLGFKPKVVDETCCGMPFGVLGDSQRLAKHKETFKERFPYKEFICLCTTCAFFIKKNYPELNPIYVINAIMEKLPQHKTKQLGIKLTYHDPCNVARGMNMVNEPRQILKQIGVELVELPTHGKLAECCGGGGGLLVTDNPLAEKLAENRVQQALGLKVDTMVTLCPTCEFNLKNSAEKHGHEMKVSNLLDLVWEALQ